MKTRVSPTEATDPAAGDSVEHATHAPTTMTRAIVTTYAARFASLIAYVALLPVVLTAFGSDAYGIYVLTASMAALFQQDLGIGDATTRFIAVAQPSRDIPRMRRIAAASGVFYLATAVVMSAATSIALALTLPNVDAPASLDQTAWALAVLGVGNVFVILAFSTHRQILAGIGRLNDVNGLLIGQAAMRIVLTVAVCWADLGIVAVAAVDLASALAFGIAAFLLRRRRAPGVTAGIRNFQWGVFRELFSVSAQLMALGVASVVIMQVGGILTALILPIAFTALYAAGQRIYLLVKEVTGSLAVAVLPVASMRHGGAEGLPHGELYLRGTTFANMLMTLVLVPALVFMPVIMHAWIGPDSAPAALVAQILILSMFANNNHLLAVPILTAQGAIHGYAILHVIWAVTGTALAVVLGEALGLPGIALGLSLPIIVLEPIYVRIALRRLDLRARDFVVRCLIVPFASVAPLAAGVFAASRWFEPDLAGAVVVSAIWVVLAVLVYGFVGLDSDSRRRLRAPFRARSRPQEDAP